MKPYCSCICWCGNEGPLLFFALKNKTKNPIISSPNIPKPFNGSNPLMLPFLNKVLLKIKSCGLLGCVMNREH